MPARSSADRIAGGRRGVDDTIPDARPSSAFGPYARASPDDGWQIHAETVAKLANVESSLNLLTLLSIVAAYNSI